MKIDETQLATALLAITAMIIIAAVGLYIIPQPMIEWKIEHGFNEVEPIEYSETEWYHSRASMIWNLDRPNFVFPNDELHYVVMFDKKYPHPIEIEPTFQFFVADSNVTSIEKLSYRLHLNNEQKTDGISYTFFARDEGVNRIQVNLKIINSSNNIVLGNQPEITKFDVQSLSTMYQQQSNETTSRAFFLSIAIGLGTVAALGFTVIVSRKHVKELQNQIVHQRTETKLAYLPYIIPRQNQTGNTYEIKSIQNIGNGPAKNIEVIITKVATGERVEVRPLGLTAGEGFLIPRRNRITGNIDEEIEVKVKFDDVTDKTYDLETLTFRISQLSIHIDAVAQNQTHG